MAERLIIGMSGASGAPLTVELLRILRLEYPEIETHLIVTQGAALTLKHETDVSLDELKSIAHASYDSEDIGAAPASGSFRTMGMVVVPCSMKTLAGIACGYADSLLLRAADVALKERRRLVLVPRECPMSTLHLRNLCTVSELGAIVMPPVPAWYRHPQTIEDVNLQIARRILSVFDIGDVPEWEGM